MPSKCQWMARDRITVQTPFMGLFPIDEKTVDAVAEHMITDMAEFIRLASHVYTKAGSRGAQAKPIKTLMAKHVDGYIGLKHDPASAQLISTSVKAHVAEHGVRV